MEITTAVTRGHVCPERAPIDDYERLLRWVRDDLADIHDPELLGEIQSALREQSSRGAPRGDLSIKEAFIETYFPRDRVQDAVPELTDPSAILRRRLAFREPLPTLEGLFALAPDTSSRGPLERASALAYAALALYESAQRCDSGVLGSTQVPGPDTDIVVQARRPSGIAVLVDGRPYFLSDAPRMSLQELLEALIAIREDASRRPPSRPLGALTSATRRTCYALRARLLEDAENARSIAAIEGAIMVLCLDGELPSTSSSASHRTALRDLYSRRGNRWYGAPQIIVDAQGNAGLIGGYTRGLNADELIQFATALDSASRGTPLLGSGAVQSALPGRVTPLFLRCSEDDPYLLAAEAEAETVFHGEAPIFSLNVGRGWLKSKGLNPNATVQYLLLLAAQDTWEGDAPPALTLAVRRKDALDWILAPTYGLDVLRDGFRRRSCQGDRREELALAFRAFVGRLAGKVSSCKQAPSPCLLFSSPPGPQNDRMLRLFARDAARYDSGYRGYLFRATRAPGTIDLITSTLTLPKSVSYLGRPGATNSVASKLGLHVLPREGSIDLIYIPNPKRAGDLQRFHARLEHWLGELQTIM